MNDIPLISERTVTEHSARVATPSGDPLGNYRDHAVYVLLGDAGIGKTTAFKVECQSIGVHAHYVTAHDFVTYNRKDIQKWKGKTFFIDGLDELRTSGSTAFDTIRRNLKRLGTPKYRLACRHTQWHSLYMSDLKQLTPDHPITLLSLDPLTESDWVRQIQQQMSEADAEQFLTKVKTYELTQLLENPLTLELLVEIAKSNKWPQNTLQLYELACRMLAKQSNERHKFPVTTRKVSDILQTAGRICAGLLISDQQSYSIDHQYQETDLQSEIDQEINHEEARIALSTRLFKHSNTSNDVTHDYKPTHRSIAEYLAASYIVSRIKEGLSVERVIALMSGFDGKVVTALHGLFTFVTALANETDRRHLIERDPLTLYRIGLFDSFTPAEGELIFDLILKSQDYLSDALLVNRKIPSHITTNLSRKFVQILESESPNSHSIQCKGFILRMLKNSNVIEPIWPTLLNFICKQNQRDDLRIAAINTAVGYSKELHHEQDLLHLVAMIESGEIRDPSDELLGLLLKHLFPKTVKPSELWKYYKAGSDSYIGAYWIFWKTIAANHLDKSDIEVLLDAAYKNKDHLKRESNKELQKLLVSLLNLALQSANGSLKVERLYDWLSLLVHLQCQQSLDWLSFRFLVSWIEKHTDKQYELLQVGLRRHVSGDDEALPEVLKRFLGATLSKSFYKSCISLAGRLIETRFVVAKDLVQLVVNRGGISADELQTHYSDDSFLSRELLDLFIDAQNKTISSEQSNLNQTKNQDSWKEQQHRDYIALKLVQDDFKNNNASPTLLYDLANVYFDSMEDFNPIEGKVRLSKHLQHDSELVEAVLLAFQMVDKRQDFPDLNDIIETLKQKRIHYLLLPYIAGLAEVESFNAQLGVNKLDTKVNTAISIFLAVAPSGYKPDWYEWCIRHHPQLVAATQFNFFKKLARFDFERARNNLWYLAYDSNHAKVSSHASVNLLRAFPVFAKDAYLDFLECLLASAYLNCKASEFSKLISLKLSRSSMPPRQRSLWLAAGCMSFLEEFETQTLEFLGEGNSESRLHQFSRYFRHDGFVFRNLDSANSRLLHFLIHQFGKSTTPLKSSPGWFSQSYEMSMIANHCITLLSRDSSEHATEILSDLVQIHELRSWNELLNNALRRQKTLRRNTEFENPTLSNVFKTLNDGAPANPADLSAIVLDCIERTRSSLRSGSNDVWKFFWNEDSYGRPTDPKSEPSCTKALKSLINSELMKSIKVSLNPSVPNDKQPDLTFEFSDFYIPLEAKKTSNERLFDSLRTQLISTFCEDPATKGYGIYLVYWFGRNRFSRKRDNQEIACPNDLRLKLMNELAEHEREKVKIIVLNPDGNVSQ